GADPVTLVALIPLFPLVGAAVLLLSGRRWARSSSGWFGSLTVAASFVTAVALLFDLMGKPAAQRLVTANLWDWVTVGRFHAEVAVRADPLSAVMALTVTG